MLAARVAERIGLPHPIDAADTAVDDTAVDDIDRPDTAEPDFDRVESDEVDERTDVADPVDTTPPREDRPY